MGSKSATAARVAGNEAEKITTPIKPLIQPRRVLSMALCGALTLEHPETEEYNLAKLY